jgi:CheY-like chemotaxis protein
VIDDDAALLELMQDLLGLEAGYQVFTSASWASSLDFIKSVEPDLVILDLMRGSDQVGWTVLELLRADPGLRELPVLLCSAAVPSLVGFDEHMRTNSGVELVAKPFDLDDLLQTVERMLVPAQTLDQQLAAP